MTEDKYLGNKSLIWHPGTGEMTAAQLAAIHTRHASAIRPIPSATALGYDHLMADADRGALLAELNRAMEEAARLQAILEELKEHHYAVLNTELESAQDITTGQWIQPVEICGTCHVFQGTYDPCARYMWPCPEARKLGME